MLTFVPFVAAQETNAPARPGSEEKKTKIHRLKSTQRSLFDAFVYLNRIPDKPYPEETTEEFVGRILGRLANQEGRIQLKLPKGMDRDAYLGFKTFIRSSGETSVGNCAACHVIPTFAQPRKRVTTLGGQPTATPTIRNLGKEVDLQKVLAGKLSASIQKLAGAEQIDPAMRAMRLSDTDVRQLIKFIGLLRDVPDHKFRSLILNATVLDTSELIP